jgi:predicted PurR-regulated permease PerM
VKAAAGLLNSLLLAGLLTIAILPVFEILRRRGYSDSLAIAIPTATLLLAVLGLIGFVGLSATQLVRVLPSYQSKVDGLMQSAQGLLAERGIDSGKILSTQVLDPGRMLTLAAGFLEAIGQALGQAVFLLLIVAFVLVETAVRRRSDRIGERMHQVARSVRQYLGITAALALAFAVFTYVLMLLVGTDLALVWAVLVFVMSFVPNIGFILSLIPPTVLTLLEFGWQRAVIIAAGFFVTNFLLDNLIKPRFMSSGLDLSPLVGLLSLVVWSYLLGPMGAILAIPITIGLRVILLQGPEAVAANPVDAQAETT